jgi:hypothetical protein
MLDAWNRAEHYRDLADECRRLAATSLSGQLRNRFSQMAKDYILLADVEEQSHAYCTRPRLQKMPRTLEPLP